MIRCALLVGSNMVGSTDAVCELCSTVLSAVAAVIPPLGETIGKRVFYCDACDHYTFTDWLGSSHPPSHRSDNPEQ